MYLLEHDQKNHSHMYHKINNCDSVNMNDMYADNNKLFF